MESLKPVSRILGLLSAILLLVACQTTTSTTGYYTDDQRLAEAVKARLAAEPGLTRVGITTRNGVVYLTGVADSAERAARAFQLASQVPGARQVVNQMQVAATTPPPVTVVTPPAAPPPVAVSPPTGSTIFPGHPPIDVTGIVAAYDPQTRIVTLQDGRMVRIGTGTIVWHAAPSNVIQPGQQIYARNAEPVSVQGLSTVVDPGWWRMGIVDRVDTANGLLVLRDGTAVRITSSTPLTMNGQQISLSHIRPGAQVALRMPATAVSGGSAAGGYALPGPTAPPASSSVIFVYPEPILR